MINSWQRATEAFQSTSPMWGMTIALFCVQPFTSISIHIPHVGDDPSRALGGRGGKISIHIPHVGDDRGEKLGLLSPEISIHIPHVGDDPVLRRVEYDLHHFNPHPPCGG